MRNSLHTESFVNVIYSIQFVIPSPCRCKDGWLHLAMPDLKSAKFLWEKKASIPSCQSNLLKCGNVIATKQQDSTTLYLAAHLKYCSSQIQIWLFYQKMQPAIPEEVSCLAGSTVAYWDEVSSPGWTSRTTKSQAWTISPYYVSCFHVCRLLCFCLLALCADLCSFYSDWSK